MSREVFAHRQIICGFQSPFLASKVLRCSSSKLFKNSVTSKSLRISLVLLLLKKISTGSLFSDIFKKNYRFIYNTPSYILTQIPSILTIITEKYTKYEYKLERDFIYKDFQVHFVPIVHPLGKLFL